MNWLRKLLGASRKHRGAGKRAPLLRYNCTRVYVGGYIGGGTNELERWMECGYQLVDGDIATKRLRPIRIRGTNTECTMFTLQTYVLYPKTETATVVITNGKRSFTVELVRAHTERSTIFKLRL